VVVGLLQDADGLLDGAAGARQAARLRTLIDAVNDLPSAQAPTTRESGAPT
jgi:hypothetical protein